MRPTRSRTELVPLATPPPSNRATQPSPKKNQLRTRSATGVLGLGRCGGLRSGDGGRAAGAALHYLPPAPYPIRRHGRPRAAGVGHMGTAASEAARAVRSGPWCGRSSQMGIDVGDRSGTGGSRSGMTLLSAGGAAARDTYGRTPPADGVQTHRPTAPRHPFLQLAHSGLPHPVRPPGVPHTTQPNPSTWAVCDGLTVRGTWAGHVNLLCQSNLDELIDDHQEDTELESPPIGAPLGGD